MPPKKVSALAKAVKDRVTKKTATVAAAITAENNPVVAPKRALKTAGKAPSRRANISKKRKSVDDDEEDDDEDEKENEAPPAKKAKTTTSRAAAPKKTKSPAAKTAAKKKTAQKATSKTIAPKTTGRKRKATDEDDNEDDNENNNDAPKAKKAKTSAAKKTTERKTAPRKTIDPIMKIKIGAQINFAPTQTLDIFVFGEGSAGELGLGSKKINGKMPIDVKRPRFNPKLSGEIPGIVQFACGGMHGIALTKDNKILTWGVNDNGALGRDTTWGGGLRDAYPENQNENKNEQEKSDEDDDDDDEDSGLNPFESTPTEIDMRNVAPGTKFVQVAASDSASFALTEDGRIYSWGTFRATEGVLGFNKDVKEQFLPILLPEPKKIVSIATGSNHVLTLDNKGKVQTWGAGEQSQLGRRIVERDARASSLRPAGLAFKRGIKIAKVAAGSYHSFALATDGQVYAWGLNNFGELGIEENMGVDGATILPPTLVESLLPYTIVDIVGGEHHSVALTDDGHVLVWGRMDSNQCGLARAAYNRENCLYDEADQPRILRVPTAHDTIAAAAAAIAVGTDTSIVVTTEGEAWSWGFNSTYQCGQGETDGEVYPPQIINNSVVRERKIVSAGCGGQFSMLASRHEE